CSPSAAHHRDRTAALRCQPARSGPGVAARQPVEHRPLRQGRSRRVGNRGPAMAGGCAMSGLRGAVADYLTIRRALGFRLVGAGRLLEQFVGFTEAAGTDTVTTQLALQGATPPPARSP